MEQTTLWLMHAAFESFQNISKLAKLMVTKMHIHEVFEKNTAGYNEPTLAEKSSLTELVDAQPPAASTDLRTMTVVRLKAATTPPSQVPSEQQLANVNITLHTVPTTNITDTKELIYVNATVILEES